MSLYFAYESLYRRRSLRLFKWEHVAHSCSSTDFNAPLSITHCLNMSLRQNITVKPVWKANFIFHPRVDSGVTEVLHTLTPEVRRGWREGGASDNMLKKKRCLPLPDRLCDRLHLIPVGLSLKLLAHKSKAVSQITCTCTPLVLFILHNSAE